MGLGGWESFGAPVALDAGGLGKGWGPSAKVSRVVGATGVGLQLVARPRAGDSPLVPRQWVLSQVHIKTRSQDSR
jgi:hypothetical protein